MRPDAGASPSSPTRAGVVIFGAGVAGLWTLAALDAAGIDAVLLECAGAGAGQTGWSQGIIHGGVKYALTGSAGAASAAISTMPAAWRAALRGAGDDGVDLRGARVLCDHQILWTMPGITARLAGLAASAALRSPVAAIDRAGAGGGLGAGGGAGAGVGGAAWWTRAPAGVGLYRVEEDVLEPASIVEALAGPRADRVALIEGVDDVEPWPSSSSSPMSSPTSADAGPRVRVRVRLAGDGGAASLEARAVVLAAGAGNEALLASVARGGGGQPRGGGETRGGAWPAMQRRPLHSVFVRGAHLPMIFGHAVEASSLPRVTITSLPGPGGVTWLLGGRLAEEGVERDGPAQLVAAKRALGEALGFLDAGVWRGVRLSAGRVDRAEALTPGHARPDVPVLAPAGAGVWALWPTKLAFAPRAAGMVLEALKSAGVTASSVPRGASAVAGWPRCPRAIAPWDEPSRTWVRWEDA